MPGFMQDGRMKLIPILAVFALFGLVAACEEAASTLQEIEDTAAKASATATEINTRAEQIQQAADDPVGALRGVVTANLTRVPTDQPGIYVVTDVQTGCQFLATYQADGTTVASIAPRVEQTADGGTRQRCIAIPGAGETGASGSAEG
jgi:guanyl-specific ribonuclease Sa